MAGGVRFGGAGGKPGANPRLRYHRAPRAPFDTKAQRSPTMQQQCACGYKGNAAMVRQHQQLCTQAGGLAAAAAGVARKRAGDAEPKQALAELLVVHCKCGLSLSAASLPAHLLRFRTQASLHGQVEEAVLASPRSRSARTVVPPLARPVSAPAARAAAAPPPRAAPQAEPAAAPSSGKRRAEASPARQPPAKRTPPQPTRGSLLLAQAADAVPQPARAPPPPPPVVRGRHQMAPGKLNRAAALMAQAKEGDARESQLANAAAADVPAMSLPARKRGGR